MHRFQRQRAASFSRKRRCFALSKLSAAWQQALDGWALQILKALGSKVPAPRDAADSVLPCSWEPPAFCRRSAKTATAMCEDAWGMSYTGTLRPSPFFGGVPRQRAQPNRIKQRDGSFLVSIISGEGRAPAGLPMHSQEIIGMQSVEDSSGDQFWEARTRQFG